jgi:molybdopterin synthase catalytic subunit
MTDGVRDWVKLSIDALDVSAAVGFVSVPAAGGVDVFLGTTRAERDESGRELEALEYEAYPEMAVGQMLELARRVRERWPAVERCVLHHRLGRVGVAEPSVVIAVSTPHRAEAFEACRWLIDALKKDVAVWKKEVWADGTGTWVHPGLTEAIEGAEQQ